MSLTYAPPKRATYQPPGSLAYPVLVHAQRRTGGYWDYLISTKEMPELRQWVRNAKHTTLTFDQEEG